MIIAHDGLIFDIDDLNMIPEATRYILSYIY